MPENNKKVVVIGAGVAGLSIDNCIHWAHGHDPG